LMRAALAPFFCRSDKWHGHAPLEVEAEALRPVSLHVWGWQSLRNANWDIFAKAYDSVVYVGNPSEMLTGTAIFFFLFALLID